MTASGGPLSAVVPSSPQSLVEDDHRERFDALVAAVRNDMPAGSSDDEVLSVVFDALMRQAQTRVEEAGLSPTRERCLEVLAESGVLKFIDARWSEL